MTKGVVEVSTAEREEQVEREGLGGWMVGRKTWRERGLELLGSGGLGVWGLACMVCVVVVGGCQCLLFEACMVCVWEVCKVCVCEACQKAKCQCSWEVSLRSKRLRERFCRLVVVGGWGVEYVVVEKRSMVGW